MVFSLKRIVAKAVRRFGYTLVPTWSAHHLPLAMHLDTIFRTLEIDCVLDVGANTGQFKRFLREHVGYSGLIISFEPLPTLAHILREQAARDPAWVVFEFALGAQNRTDIFFEMQDTQFSSFLPPDKSAVSSYASRNKPVRRIKVEVKTLDSIYPMLTREYGFSRPYLKTDTQGYDLEVICGAQETLARVPALQFEASVLPIYQGMPDYRTVIDRLEQEGYQLSMVVPTNPVGSLYLVEFDCVMVRKKAK